MSVNLYFPLANISSSTKDIANVCNLERSTVKMSLRKPLKLCVYSNRPTNRQNRQEVRAVCVYNTNYNKAG
jgi:predicted transcriptional regulator